jgi:hypothetical protein
LLSALRSGLGIDLACLFGLAPVYLLLAVGADVVRNYPELYRRLLRDPQVRRTPAAALEPPATW